MILYDLRHKFPPVEIGTFRVYRRKVSAHILLEQREDVGRAFTSRKEAEAYARSRYHHNRKYSYFIEFTPEENPTP